MDYNISNSRTPCYNRMMKNTSWGSVAGWYDQSLENDADTFQSKVLLPNLIRIVRPKKGMRILDLACGQGFFTRAFAEAGATVSGCDISPELIELARGQSPDSVDYFVAGADSFSGQIAESGPVDVITIVLALQNIENMVGTIAECGKAIAQSGRLIIVLNHPAFRIPKESSWQWEAGSSVGSKVFRRIDAYMSDSSTRIDMTPGEKDLSKKRYTVSFHHPLQSYFKALTRAGFAVTRLEEWISHRKSSPGPRSAEEDRSRKEIPMFLCLEAINTLI